MKLKMVIPLLGAMVNTELLFLDILRTIFISAVSMCMFPPIDRPNILIKHEAKYDKRMLTSMLSLYDAMEK